jgi:PAS domain S-box-containing protein
MSNTTILIVEDEAIVAADLNNKLRCLGYEVAGIASEGEEAIALAGSLHPNLVIMDIQLEGSMDGIEAAQAIQNIWDVPVIYLTAHSDSATIARAKLTGPIGYILKPFEERELAIQVELALYKHQADQQVRRQREWLRVTLCSIGDAVIATDSEGCISFINPVAESLTGWTTDEAVGLPISQVFRVVNEQTGRPLEEPVTRVLREGCAVALANHAALITKDGRLVPVEDTAAPILEATGQVIGAVLVFHDVTEKRRVEEEQHQLNITLENRVVERTAMAESRALQLHQLALELSKAEDRERKQIALILHDDLQQYLAAIHFHLQMLLPKDSADPIMKERVEQMEQLISVSIKKCRSLSYELSPPVLHQSGFLAALNWLAEDVEKKHGLKVILKTFSDSEPDSSALASLLFRSVRELLFNAIKHSGAKSAVVETTCEGDWIRIRVKDNGRGCVPDAYQAKDRNMTGFGLFNLKERITFLGGRLDIESAPGKGCCVTLEVPKQAIHKSKTDTENHEAIRNILQELEVTDNPDNLFQPKRQRILLADDHAVMRKGLSILLEDIDDFQVVAEAADGRQAVRLASELKPDVILMDISMPEMDGIEATAEIHQLLPNIRIIGLSMHDDPGTKDRMIKAGAAAYIYKASPAEKLIDTIRGCLST